MWLDCDCRRCRAKRDLLQAYCWYATGFAFYLMSVFSPDYEEAMVAISLGVAAFVVGLYVNVRWFWRKH